MVAPDDTAGPAAGLAVEHAFYFERLYPFQDAVLARLADLDTGFYLTRGTAASRGYLEHRFSDDLDLFVNDDDQFALWADRVIAAVAHHGPWRCEVGLRDTRFVRATLALEDVALKIEMVNDVPSRVGEPWQHPVLGSLDTAENILANKVSAVLARTEPKDLADLWGFCCRRNLALEEAILGAQGKAAGIFPADLARALFSVTEDDWAAVRWIEPPPAGRFVADLQALAETLIVPRL